MRPIEQLEASRHRPVLVELRGGRRFRGRLESFDQHLNLVLASAEELVEGGGATARPGLTLLRGDSVVFISP